MFSAFFYISVFLLSFFYRRLDASVCCMWYVVCFTVVIDAGIFPVPKTNLSLGRRNKMTLTLAPGFPSPSAPTVCEHVCYNNFMRQQYKSVVLKACCAAPKWPKNQCRF